MKFTKIFTVKAVIKVVIKNKYKLTPVQEKELAS